MIRRFAYILVCAALAATIGRVEAQKSGGSSGRSYSSGSRSTSSPSRSTSSPSRSSPSSSPSRSPSSSSSGKSYSSPSSRPTSSAPSPSSGSSGKSYSSGPPRTSTPPTSSPPPRTSPTSPSPGKGYSSGSPTKPSVPSSSPTPTGKSYSSGSPPSSSAPARPTTTPAAPSGKSYTSGSPSTGTPAPSSPTSAPSGRSYTPPSSQPGPGYDSLAADAKRREESRAAYQPAPQPKPQYTDSRTQTTYNIDREQDRRIEQLRRDLDYERWVNRPRRIERWYTGYPGPGWTTVYYRDPYSDWFWWWILSQNLETRASWAYHHRNYIDEARYQELLRRDAQLEAKIRQLEAERVARNPQFTPGGADYDLMFDDSYVDAVYNPTYDPGRVGQSPTVASRPPPAPRSSSGAASVFIWLMVIVLVAFGIWLIFFKRWTVPGD